MEPDTIQFLRSPRTGEPLRLVTVGGSPTLVGAESGECFAIRAGVAELLLEDQVTGYNLRYQRFYDRIAMLYDPVLRCGARLIRGRERDFRMAYLCELEVGRGDRLLEVSVGTGANLRLLPPDVRLVGLDISRGMLAQCRRNLRKWRLQADLILGNAEALPFRDEAFDAVLHVGGINAFSNRGQALREMYRVARPGAKIVVADETAQLIGKISWFPGARRMLQRHADRLEPPVSLVPDQATEIAVRTVVRGNLYVLSFRKPIRAAGARNT